METDMKKTLMAAAALTIAAAISTPASADRLKVGTLDCDISGGVGLIITSKKSVNCVFTPSGGGRRETYVGSIRKFGLDLGATAGGRMVWAVFADSAHRGAPLSGNYAGASGEASVGVGLGANVLVGGSNKTFALQPVSVQGQAGLNVAVGVTELSLRKAG